MENTFDPNDYMQYIANELIANFSVAGKATTPGLVGIAREKPIRQKLETLLPPMVGVGTGCIIDSFGNTSKQMDIVIYEKNICPVYSINDTPETTYYPCEGVIAVGEVKSVLNNKELEDIFAKVNSVKILKRFAVPSEGQLTGPTVCYRQYGSIASMQGTKDEEFNQDLKLSDQIFFFAFCGELDVLPNTLLDKFVELSKNYEKKYLINLISILNYGLLIYTNKQLKQIKYWLGDNADSIYITNKRNNNFQFLINRLLDVIRSFRTVQTSAFARYTKSSEGQILLDGIFRDL